MTPSVDFSTIRCAKHKCKTRDWVTHRHHLRHQFMFVKAFEWRVKQSRYIAFVERYFEYRDEDTVRVCSSHHREAHEKYDIIIQRWIKRLRKPLRAFTWNEAEGLMDELEEYCRKWLNRSTPGAAPWPSNGYQKRKAEEAYDYLAAVRGEVPF